MTKARLICSMCGEPIKKKSGLMRIRKKPYHSACVWNQRRARAKKRNRGYGKDVEHQAMSILRALLGKK